MFCTKLMYVIGSIIGLIRGTKMVVFKQKRGCLQKGMHRKDSEKGSMNRYRFTLLLKLRIVILDLISAGDLFQSRGAANWKVFLLVL